MCIWYDYANLSVHALVGDEYSFQMRANVISFYIIRI